MSPYRFHDLRPFQGKATKIKRPREFTFFSFDDQHVCRPLSDVSLRYYYPPLFRTPGDTNAGQIDLSIGFHDFDKYEDSADLRLYPLLDTLERHEKQTGVKQDADVVTWRGMMTKV